MIKMPWSETCSPHVVLEINSECNISCEGCYKKLNGSSKPVQQINEELGFALSQRKIQTVSIAGGEPTLHPRLCEIISSIHKKNLKTALLTNGLKLNGNLLDQLKSAGLDVIMLHVDQGQKRPDLPSEPEIDDVESLIAEISAMIAQKGIEVGLAVTVHEDKIKELMHTIDFIIRSEHINLLLATNYVDIDCLGNSALQVNDRTDDNSKNYSLKSTCDRRRNVRIANNLKERFKLLPYSYLPADTPDQWGDGNWPWMLYFVPVVYTGSGHYYFRIQSNFADKILLRIVNFFNRRPIFYSGQNQTVTSLRVMFNIVSRLRFIEGFKFFKKALSPHALIKSKGMIFENGPVLSNAGQISCTEFCTNATVRDGKLIHLCVADHISCEGVADDN